LTACDHAISADGGWHVFVAAEMSSASVPSGQCVVAGVIDFTFPYPPHNFTLTINADVESLGVGHLLSPPSAAVTATTLWLAGDTGLAGVALQQHQQERTLTLPAGHTLTGLHSSPSGRVYGILYAGDARVASFQDTGEGEPTPDVAPNALPSLFSDPSGTRAALLTDEAAVAVLAGQHLATANASSGALQTSALLQCEGAECPSSMAYESFVF